MPRSGAVALARCNERVRFTNQDGFVRILRLGTRTVDLYETN